MKPFNLRKWHHQLYLFTAKYQNAESVFIKLTDLEVILSNENEAYRRFKENNFLKNHLIDYLGYFKKRGV